MPESAETSSRIRLTSQAALSGVVGVLMFCLLFWSFSAKSWDKMATTALSEHDSDGLPLNQNHTLADALLASSSLIENPQSMYLAEKQTTETRPVLLLAQAQSQKAPEESAQTAGTARTPLRLFGTVEFRTPIKNLPKWERVRDAENKKPSFVSGDFDVNNKQVAQRWAKVRQSVADAPLKDKMREVNKFFNQWPYKTDREVWGVEDYWATPREFVMKSGDCEDYAISKYYALRDLGVPADLLRVAAVKDVIRNIGHAVLVVFDQNDAYILDNLTNLVLSHKKLSHYAPQYTVNEEFLWRHVKPKASPAKNK